MSERHTLESAPRHRTERRLAHLAAYLAAALALLSAALVPGAARADGGETAQCADGVEFLGFSDALDKATYEGTNVGGLSALARNPELGVYYSLVDNEEETDARYYTARIPVDADGLGDPRLLDVTTIRNQDGDPFTGADFDGEGLALSADDDLYLASETEPSIRRFGLEGAFEEELDVPERFQVAPDGEAEENQTFESLSLAPSGVALYTALEGPLASDGRTEDERGRVRILRYDDGDGFAPGEQYYYLADPTLGVTEVVALSDTELLVLERGFVPDEGNTVLVYRVSTDGAEDVSGVESLADDGVMPLAKELVFDLADCPESGAETPGTQPNALLDNYESIALGPELEDGRRALLLQSDDNFNDAQVTRVVAVALELEVVEMPATGGGAAQGDTSAWAWPQVLAAVLAVGALGLAAARVRLA